MNRLLLDLNERANRLEAAELPQDKGTRRMTLREPLTILAIIAAALLPGALAVSLWGKRFRADPLEFLFAALTLGVFMIGWPALLLAELGYFSLVVPWACLWAALVLVLGGWLAA